MDDLEITKACAEMMGYPPWHNSDGWPTLHEYPGVRYDPLRDDAQCFALVKKYPHVCIPAMTHAMFDSCEDIGPNAKPIDFNRCVCECVAKLMARG